MAKINKIEEIQKPSYNSVRNFLQDTADDLKRAIEYKQEELEAVIKAINAVDDALNAQN